MRTARPAFFYVTLALFALFALSAVVQTACSSGPDLPAALLKKTLEESKSGKSWLIRRNAVLQMSKWDDDDSGLALVKAAGDSSQRVKLAAFEGIGQRKLIKGRPVLVRHLDSKDPVLRAAALESLCLFKDQADNNLYYKATQDSDWTVRSAALECYRRMPDEKSQRRGFGRALLLSVDPVISVQQKALDNLLWYNTDSVPAFLVRISYRKQLDTISICALIDAMGEYIDIPQVRYRLEQLSRDKSHRIRWTARRVLWEKG